MRPTYHPTRVEIDAAAIRRNIRRLRRRLAPQTAIFGVVKANAYGLGALGFSRVLQEEGVGYLCVATPEEAFELRDGGIVAPILVMAASPYEAAEEYVRHGITPTLTDMRFAEAMSAAASKLGKPGSVVPVHLKVDSGMGRIGFHPEEALAAAQFVAGHGGLALEGVFTHFAGAGQTDTSYAHVQYERFDRVLKGLREAGIQVRYRHCCNSPGTLNFPNMHLDAVRTACLPIGFYPSEHVLRDIELELCFSFKTAVALVRQLPTGERVGYGMTYETTRETRIAVLNVGSADGFPRALSNKGEVLIGGRKCPIVGRVCMDQCMIDVTELPQVAVGDEAVLLGRQGDEEISIYEFGERSGILAYGLISCGFSQRVSRCWR